MFFSFQQEYPKNEQGIINAINNFKGSEERNRLLVLKSYYKGNNDFIDKYKRLIWSDECKRAVENVYAPNYKTRYNFFGDMVSQKINSLFAETPTIENVDEHTAKQMCYALKNAGEEASVMGYSFIYEGFDNFKPFETENCIAYVDDITDELKRLIRFWVKKINEVDMTFFELYEEDGFTTYKIVNNRLVVAKEKQGYKQRVFESRLSRAVENVGLSKLPIAIFKNNKEMESDLKPNIKSKIDMIDFIQSGLINNIDEFSDVWITINVPNATPEQAQQIKDTVRRTKATVFAGSDDKNSVGFETMQIPYEARAKAVEMLKSELVEDAGVIDFRDIKGQATNVQIQARLLKLQQRVSDFEWFADEVAEQLVLLYEEYYGLSFEPNITFQKLYIKNNLEIINMAISLHNFVSEYTFLNLLKSAGVVDNIEEEIERIRVEADSKFTIVDDEVEDEQPQTNREDIEE